MATNSKNSVNQERLLVVEQRLILVAFAVGLLATVIFIVAFSSEHWVHVTLQSLQQRNDSRGVFLKQAHYHGLWRICREEFWYKNRTTSNETYPYRFCRTMYFSLPKDTKPELKDVERKMIDFRRSTVAMGFIAIFLSIAANSFTWYSLGQLRYMYKRLAGCIQLITGATCWVTLEVFRQAFLYEERNMKENVPEFSEIRNGWSYNIVWLSCAMFLFTGIVLLACSRKRKGIKARSLKEAKENEPVVLGRI